jgi:microcystin-dependent protein
MGSGHTLGERGGEQAHTLSISEIPTHTHVLNGATQTGSLVVAPGNLSGASPSQTYQAPDNNLGAMNAASISNVGGNQAHLNMQPFLVLNFSIALQGIFPSQT